jgi:hypothetical protein
MTDLVPDAKDILNDIVYKFNNGKDINVELYNFTNQLYSLIGGDKKEIRKNIIKSIFIKSIYNI